MSNKHRCINAFAYCPEGGGMRIYAGGVEVDGDDPILETHSAHFAPIAAAVSVPAPSRIERATAEPGELRELSAPKRRPGRPRKNPQPVEPEIPAEPPATVEPEPVVESSAADTTED